MAQLKLTSPANAAEGVITRLKVAFCPALMVCEVGDPDADVTLKSGAAAPIPDKAIDCGSPGALSLMVRVPMRLPVAVGLNLTEIRQLAPAESDPHVLVCEKSPEIEMFVTLSVALPILVNVTT